MVLDMTKTQESGGMPQGDAWLTPGEAAKRLGVSTTTLRAMALRGQVASLTLPSGHRRYLASSITARQAAA